MNAPDRGQSLLSIERLHVRYDAVEALRDVNVTVKANEAVALIGANGAGKSTLFKAVMGFLKPAAGSIAFLGTPMARVRPERRARLGLGYCPEGRRVFPGMTVRENLEVAVTGPPASRRELVGYAYELFPALAERPHHSEIQQRLRMFRVDFQRLLELLERPIGLVRVVVAHPEVCADVHIFRVELPRIRVPLDRISVTLRVEVEIAQFDARLGVRGLLLGHAGERLDFRLVQNGSGRHR